MRHRKLLEKIKLNNYDVMSGRHRLTRFSQQCGLFNKRRDPSNQYFLWLVIESQSTLKLRIPFYVVEDVYAKKNDQKVFIWTSNFIIIILICVYQHKVRI